MVNGTLIWYYYICHREVWFIAHSIEAQQDNDNMALGKHIHETFYQRDKKEVLIDNTIKIDVIRNKRVIAEVKKSSKSLQSAKMQVAFYLYYLKKEKNIELTGEILIPKERKKEEIILTPELEKELERAIENIEKIIVMDKPPELKKINYCKSCAYKEMCWC